MKFSLKIQIIALTILSLGNLGCEVSTDGGAGKPGSKQSALRQLTENFHGMNGQQVLETVGKLTQGEALSLSIYEAFLSAVFRKACEANGQLVATFTTGQQTCAQAYQSYQWAQQNTVIGNADDYGESQRNQLLIGLKCASGEIDKGSCTMYGAVVSNVNNMNNETGTRIIANIGNGCVVGVDPNCVQ